jgi:ADP-ribose pyrophosphatase YjhB (NUDIX family)
MNREISIFVGERQLRLVPTAHPSDPGRLQIKESMATDKIFTSLAHSDTDFELRCTDVHATLQHLCKTVQLQQAGGGLVRNSHGEYLLIFRRGKWDLPKGKLEDGENIQQCALREVAEETGLSNITLGDYITDTHHAYMHREQWVLKQSTWYKMDAPMQRLIPQIEEDIEIARWCDLGDIKQCLQNTYGNIGVVFSSEGIT